MEDGKVRQRNSVIFEELGRESEHHERILKN